MTDPFHDRAGEIVAAYGADPARWPADERAAAERAVADSDELRARVVAARVLDADLAAWAAVPVAGDASAAVRAVRRPRPATHWAAGATAIAASLAAMVWLTPAHAPTQSTAVTVSSDDASAFAQLFTPTPDEELVL